MRIKKFLSLAMALVMLFSVMPMAAFAEDVDYQQGTLVTYGDGDNEHASEAYTITVPALLKPSQSGTVTATGTWASNRVLTVTADETVTLTNSIKAADEKVLDVTFFGIAKAGSNTEAVSATETVGVADIQNALFGVWSGKFNYNVEMTTAEDNTIKANFADNSWSAIAAACQNNEVPATWNIGDTKEMQIGDKVCNVVIIGKNHDIYADGSGTAPLTFQTVEIIEKRAMNDESTNVGGWAGSDMYTYLNTELIETLDPDVKNNIKSVTKVTGLGGNPEVKDVETSSNKLFLLSSAEVINQTVDTPSGYRDHYLKEGSQYAYYAQDPDNTSGANIYAKKYMLGEVMPDNLDPDILKIIQDNIDSPEKLLNEIVPTFPEDAQANLQAYFEWINRESTHWWLRSPYIDMDAQFVAIEYSSLSWWKTPPRATYEYGISFAFCF